MILRMSLGLATLVLIGCVHGEEGYTTTSMVSLISDPDAYNGKPVLLSGFFKLEHEESALYLTREHAFNVLSQNAIWLDLNDAAKQRWKGMSDSYVSVWGRFESGPSGHFHSFSGSVTHIERMVKNLDRKAMEALREN